MTGPPPERADTDCLRALACLDFLDTEPEVFIAAAAAAGFDGVTLRVTGSRTSVAGDVGRDPGRRARVLAALRSTGMHVLDVEVLRLRCDLTAGEIRSVIDGAAELGAPRVLVVDSELGTDRARDLLAGIVDEASAVGVLPCLEPMAFTACRTLSDALATAVPAGAGVLVDALHLHRSGGTPADVAAAVTACGDACMPYVQLCDASWEPPGHESGGENDALRREAIGRRLLPGHGDLDLMGLLAALPGRPLVVEAPTAGSAAMSPEARATAAATALTELLDNFYQTIA
ncbi:sugar phosphate isomerase/epimerase [Prauserella sediminis]|uniref:Sugar phosphate isomerase/epimerase n=1 Tax=Prauserella sediminis TaxID=577680 RepID=A0A839XS42_9PSEU|nr:sugar phosphate isomerase/epimerase [Prauserella sediminis]MBB3665551.1 sugar phosphate isomerase/epimerase [Prauserella sediminis]